ncbi:HAD family hydrolase [Paenibacillus validus]|uniref:HAD family hydrolase n=4 Tax=Paenibacillus validus TaxID=44253 RepID=UPI000FDC791A|nr:HAD family hydrolase [Paenibacillus validus]
MNRMLHSLDLWKGDRYLAPLARDDTYEKIEMLSLDIFDTLLLRACDHPTDVFRRTAERAVSSGSLKRSVSPHEFRSMRGTAERRARDKQLRLQGHDEITLSDIYAEMPAHLGRPEEVLRIELATEAETCYLNPNVASLLRCCKAAGKRIALLSDMYLSSEQLLDLLAAAGLERTEIDVLLVSGEQRRNKSTGGLFERLLELCPGLSREAIVHIGDNERADVRGAALQRIRAIHYAVVPESFDSAYHWEAVRHRDVLPPLKSLRKLAGVSQRQPETGAPAAAEAAAFHEIGAGMAGPFLTALCDWAIDVCIAENRTEVHPLMREGVLLTPMLEQAARSRGIPLRVVPLYVSRQATYLASLRRFDEAELERLFRSGDAKVGELLQKLGQAEEAHAFGEALGLSLQECRTMKDEQAGTLLEKLRRFLLDARTRAKIDAAIAHHRQLLCDYLKQTCETPERMVTLDIGFHGNIKKSLHAALKYGRVRPEHPEQSEGAASRAGEDPPTIHLLAVGGAGIGDLLLEGIDIRSFLGSSGENEELGKALVRSPAFLEELMMGAFGSTTGYARDEQGRVQPQLAHVLLSGEELAYKRAFQEGALAFQRYYYAWKAERPDCRPALGARESFKPLHRLIDMPTPQEASLLGNLRHQDNHFGTYTRICEPVDERWFEHGRLHFLDHGSYDPSVVNVYWPQGTLTRRHPYELYLHHLRQQDATGYQGLLLRMCLAAKEQGAAALHLVGSGAFLEAAKRAAFLHKLAIAEIVDPRREESWAAFLLAAKRAESSGGRRHIWLASVSEAEVVAWREAIAQAVRGSGTGAGTWEGTEAGSGGTAETGTTIADPFLAPVLTLLTAPRLPART